MHAILSHAPASSPFPPHRVVSRDEWISHRQKLLAEEKALTRSYDELCRQRRELPWVRLEKNYVFDSAQGPVTLAGLFGDRSQLIVQHFMLGPGWEEGCVGCSFGADHLDPALVHLTQRDVAFAAVSRAPLAEIEPFHRRMGWGFRWVSSHGSDFNTDFYVSFQPEDLIDGQVYYNYDFRDFVSEELPGISIFAKDADGAIYHTYSVYGRGLEPMLTTYFLLDLTPKGRDETGATGNLTDWVRHHDRYDRAGLVAASGRALPAATS